MFNARARIFILLAFLTFLFITAGRYLGGSSGALYALAMCALMNFSAYWWSDRWVLRQYRAEPVREEEAPEYYEIARRLCDRASLPLPALYVLPSASANAFATGRDPQHAAIAVTSGLFDLLNPKEFEAVLAHEIGHIQARDTLTASIAAVLAGALMSLTWSVRGLFRLQGRSARQPVSNPVVLLLVILLAPLAASIIRFAVMRECEFEADAAGARLCGEPLHLASALKRMDAHSRRLPLQTADFSAAHVLILSPFQAGWWRRLFLTHPPLEERLWRLDQMHGRIR